MSLIIIISGKQGSGKTTLGHNLTKYYQDISPKTVHCTLAEPIYELHNKLYETKNRKALQSIGDWARAICPDIFIKAIISKIDKSDIAIISDCRRLDEIRALSSIGRFRNVITVRLDCDVESRKRRCPAYGSDDHLSETELDEFDFSIRIDTNTLTVDEVRNRVITYVIDYRLTKLELEFNIPKV